MAEHPLDRLKRERERQARRAVDWTLLATYNAERHRGLVHTPEMDAAMAIEQARFDAEREAQLVAEGWTPMVGGGWIRVDPSPPRRRWWKR